MSASFLREGEQPDHDTSTARVLYHGEEILRGGPQIIAVVYRNIKGRNDFPEGTEHREYLRTVAEFCGLEFINPRAIKMETARSRYTAAQKARRRIARREGRSR